MSMRTRFVFLLSFFCCLLYAQQPLYKQAHVPIEKRVDDLISRMTLTEQIGHTIGTVTVTMGGTDVTSTAYDDETGVITIAEVTGAIVITASATADT